MKTTCSVPVSLKKIYHPLFSSSNMVNSSGFLMRCVLEAGELFNTTLRQADLSDKGIHRSRKFVTKVLSVNLDSLNDQWQLLQQYSTVRGVLAHGEMQVPENKLNGLGHLKKTGMVTPQGNITVKTEDVRKFVHLAYDYLGSVIHFISDKK